MQTFKQFLEAREVKDIPQNDIREILEHINDSRKIVEFILHCAEDCFQFNDERTRSTAQRCIALVRKWLKNPQSVKRNEFNSAANDANLVTRSFPNNFPSNSASNTASNAAWTVYTLYFNNIDLSLDSAFWGSYSAINAFADASGYERNTFEWQQIYNQKLQEYKEKAKSLVTTRSGNPVTTPFLNDIQDDDNDLDDPKHINNNVLSSIMSMIDHLYDEQETGEEHFFYEKGNEFVFDLGNNVKLTANNLNDLAKKIYKNKYFLRRLKELYNANI